MSTNFDPFYPRAHVYPPVYSRVHTYPPVYLGSPADPVINSIFPNLPHISDYLKNLFDDSNHVIQKGEERNSNKSYFLTGKHLNYTEQTAIKNDDGSFSPFKPIESSFVKEQYFCEYCGAISEEQWIQNFKPKSNFMNLCRFHYEECQNKIEKLVLKMQNPFVDYSSEYKKLKAEATWLVKAEYPQNHSSYQQVLSEHGNRNHPVNIN